MWNKCRNCGVEFESRWSVRKYSVKHGAKMMTCSKKCAEERRATLLKARTVCVVCGGPKNSRHSSTCSPMCRAKKKSESATGKHLNLCTYDAPHIHDYNNMISILHRKGYVKTEDCQKEKWTYSTAGFPRIQWVDRVARGVVVSRKTRTSKKQQRHEDGV